MQHNHVLPNFTSKLILIWIICSKLYAIFAFYNHTPVYNHFSSMDVVNSIHSLFNHSIIHSNTLSICHSSFSSSYAVISLIVTYFSGSALIFYIFFSESFFGLMYVLSLLYLWFLMPFFLKDAFICFYNYRVKAILKSLYIDFSVIYQAQWPPEYNCIHSYTHLTNIYIYWALNISRQQYWSGLPFPSTGDVSDLGMETGPPVLQADCLKFEPHCRRAERWSTLLQCGSYF